MGFAPGYHAYVYTKNISLACVQVCMFDHNVYTQKSQRARNCYIPTKVFRTFQQSDCGCYSGSENVENATRNVENATENVTANAENDTQNVENVTRNVENVTQNVENVTQDIENVNHNVENATENLTENVENVTCGLNRKAQTPRRNMYGICTVQVYALASKLV